MGCQKFDSSLSGLPIPNCIKINGDTFEQLNHTISGYKRKKYMESIVKSQNIVEQANSNPNNISPTMSRRHIICKSPSVSEMNQ